jgi:hypothetical protein
MYPGGEALEPIITLYENWQKPDKATEWRAKKEEPSRPTNRTGKK